MVYDYSSGIKWKDMCLSPTISFAFDVYLLFALKSYTCITMTDYRLQLNNYLQDTFKNSSVLLWSTRQLGREDNSDWEAVALINHVAYGTGTARHLVAAKEEAARQALVNLRGH